MRAVLKRNARRGYIRECRTTLFLYLEFFEKTTGTHEDTIYYNDMLYVLYFAWQPLLLYGELYERFFRRRYTRMNACDT